MTLDPLILIALAATGLVAGFVDAVAGGGGLITIPVLLSLGMSPVAALATNKAQSVVGTLIAAITYWRRGLVDPAALWPSMLAAGAGAMVGAHVVRDLDVGLLQSAVPVALIAIAAYFALAPRLGDEDRQERLSFEYFVPVMGFLIGFYDGLFGPGTGSFLAMGFVALFGLGVRRATGHTKALNLMSNLGALVLFAAAGEVAWAAAGVMAVGQVAGGYLGARVGIRFGAKLIRPLVIAVSVILAVRLLLA